MNVLPVAFGMVPAGHDRAVMKQLNDDIVANGYHLTSAGVFAIRYLMTLLSDYGYTDTAFRVATQTDEPSWGWWIANGHSTMFEGWSLNSRSYDHHYFGSISSWFFESLAGIRPDAPGYSSVVIQPHVPAGLDHASASIRTVRGVVASAWTRAPDGSFELQVTVPGNVQAEVWVPAADRRAQVEPDGAALIRTDAGYAVYEVGAGSYVFRSRL
jgi:alpha-L-rhamnosidase